MSHASRAVCLPRLSVVTIAIVRWHFGARLEVHFDDYPRYAKALLRWLGIPEAWILVFYEALAGAAVRRLPRGDALIGQGRLMSRAMQVADDLCVALESPIATSPWTKFCGEFLGAQPARAFALKQFSWDWAWPLARTAVVARAVVSVDRTLTVISGPIATDAWRRNCEAVLAREDLAVFPWPLVVAGAWCQLMNVVWFVWIWGAALVAVARQGVRMDIVSRQSSLLAVELVDPRRMGGGSSDSDHWIDGHKLRRGDVLFYVLREQREFLRRRGVDVDGAIARLVAQGYRIVDIQRLPFSASSVGEILRVLSRLPVFSGGDCRLGAVALKGWRMYLAYVPFFDQHAPRNVAHTVCPNGMASLRLDSGVVTGLCRRYGCRSVGYQNRLIYDTFEFDFDCYDLFLAWGLGWWDAWRPLLREVKCVREVGCSQLRELRGSAPDNGLVVIFTFELQGNLYPPSYTYRLLRACLNLARRHPERRFVVKMKDPEDVDVLLRDSSFRRECEDVANFSFARLARHACSDLLRRADFVIAAAYTTPGSDALLAGKRIIFYSELAAGCSSLKSIPVLAAETPAELETYFLKALAARCECEREAWLDRLDPYRDGSARERIIERILEAPYP